MSKIKKTKVTNFNIYAMYLKIEFWKLSLGILK